MRAFAPAREESAADRAAQEIARLRQGEAEALEWLFHTYYERLVNFAFRVTQRVDSAKDVVQDVFIRLWERRSEILVSDSVSGYLYQAVRREAVRAARAQVASGDATALDREADWRLLPSEGLDADALDAAMARAVHALPSDMRLVFTLHREHGMTYAEIASVLGIAVGTVKTQMTRAMARLRHQLAAFI